MSPTNATERFLGDEGRRLRTSVELRDVQGLWGGRRILITGVGRALVQIVTPSMEEKRYELTPSEDQIRALLAHFIEVDFLTIPSDGRAGIPDEARPSIRLTSHSGVTHAIAKWAGIKDERFDSLYRAIRAFEEETRGRQPVYVGMYQPGVE